MSNKRRFDELTHQEKCEIYNLTQSGKYYLKEILVKFNITEHTHRRIINAFKTFLHTGKTDQM